MKDGKLETADFLRDVRDGDWLAVAGDIVFCDDSLITLLTREQREACATALARSIINNKDDAGIIECVGKDAAWAHVGRLLDLRYTDAERSEITWLRKARQGGDTKLVGRRIDALLEHAVSLHFRVSHPDTRAGMALLAKAGMIQEEVRARRRPEDPLP